MSDIINNLLLTEKTTSVSSQITPEQTLKETPSLFDSLLVASSSKDEIIVANNQTTESKVENIKVEENSPKVDLDNKLSSTEVQITNENEVNTDKTTDKTIQTSTSLLDRLVMEAKNNAKDIKSEDLNNKINNTLIETKVQELEVLVDTKESDIVPTDKLNTIVKSDENITDKTISTTNTLSDKLIVEAKNKLELDKTEVKNNNKSTILPEEIKSEEIVVSDKATETNSLLDKLINDARNTLLTDTKEVKVDTAKIEDNKLNLLQEEIKSEEKVVDKTLSTNSLLDRLIIESKDDVKDIKIKDLTTGVETESSILIKKQLDDLEVSVDTNEEVNNKLNTIIKETKNNEVILDNEVVTTKSLLNKVTNDVKDNIKDTNQEIKIIVDSNNSIIDETTTIIDNIIQPTETINNDVIINNSDENIDNNIILENKIVNKEDASVIIKTDEKLSLMDKLIQKNSEKVTFENIETLSDNIEETEIPLKETITKDLISNIYLGSQKNQVNNQSLFNKNEAITLLKEGNSIQSVKTSAEILELGLENIDIQQAVEDKVEVKKSNIQIDNKNNLIDNLLSKKSIKSEEIKYLITTSVEASKALAENNLNLADDVTINVNSPLSYNIQSKIIGAKQQMATMMSDIARQMYENYKPPVTAFRINLNPQDLGSIAILMKNDKNNGLSISMNISNSVTLDTLIENQNVLKNSLNKTFNDNTKFNLDFNSSNENSSNQSSSNQNGQQNNRNNQQQMATQSILQLQEENKDREEKIIDYM